MIIPSNIEALNNTLQNINAKVKKLESNTKNLEESIMDEIVQRIWRSHNLIFFDLEENTSKSDISLVRNILDTILRGSYDPDVTVKRFGRSYFDAKTRPACATFKSADVPLSILKNKNKCQSLARSNG